MERLKKFIIRLRADQSGAIAVEYAFIAAALAVAIIPAINIVVTALGGEFEIVTDAFDLIWQ